MTATDELRRLLDERGVEWGAEESKLDHVTTWNANGGQAMFYESKTTNPNLLQVNYYHLTPEQAVEATLGRETCEILGYDDGYAEGLDGEMYQYADPRYFLSCEHEAYGSVVPNYCPVCGRKVVDE